MSPRFTTASAPASTAPVSRRAVVKAAAAAPLVAALGGVGVGRAGAQETVVVTMVTDTAGLGDQNFNDLANRGLERAEAELGIDGRVIESRDAAAYIPNLTQAAEQGELTIGVGFLLVEAITEVATQYPDEFFLLIDGVSEAPNVAGVTFRENEGAFLAGVVAGLVTETDTVGVVGGIAVPPVVRYAVGFEAGVRSVNPEAEVIVAYADSFGDPALGRELTLAQFNQGADIVFPVAGATGIGSFNAAVEQGEGFWVIAADADQSQLGAENQLAVASKGVDTAVYTVSEQVVNDAFAGGELSLGLAEGGVDLLNPGGFVPDDVMAVVD
nr:BMP family ABC transporter substrate-binding protein [Chloroflexia bacterium]